MAKSKTAPKGNPATKVVTGGSGPRPELVRFSYVAVHEPRASEEGGEKKYQVSIIIPKTAKKTILAFKNAINAAIADGIPKLKGWKNRKPGNLKNPLHDGDEERPDDEAYADSYYVNARSKTKPGIIDEDGNEILSAEDFFSGCWGRASVTCFPYDGKSNGVGVALNHVQKLEDGERLGAQRSTAAEDFGFAENDEDFDIL